MAVGQFLCVLVCFLLVSFSFAERKVTTRVLTPQSHDNEVPNSIGYTTAVGSNDTFHYLVTAFGVPTVFVLYTNTVPSPQLNVDWDRLTGNQSEMSHSISFDNKAVKLYYSYAIVLSRLFEYNDTNDDADITKYSRDSVAWNIYDFSALSWNNISNTSDVADNSITLTSNSNSDLFQKNGTLSFKFSAFASSGRENELPRLQYDDTITLFDLTLNDLWTNLSMSRFVVEVVVVGGDKSGMRIDETQSIDDEHTPGVFKIFNLLTRSQNENSGGFLQWKPVCYLKPERARGVGTMVKHYGIQEVADTSLHQTFLNQSILYAFHGDSLLSVSRVATNMSFGLTKDKWYTGTNFTTWSGSIGYGKPPADAVSLLVIIVISAGLGLPAIIMVIGGVYVCLKKKKPQEQKMKNISKDYQPLPN